MDWRFQKAVAGSGALADLCSHLLHLARWWAGDLRRVSAQLRTIVPERKRAGSGEQVPVDVDDVCSVMGEFVSGAVCQLTASRVLFGHKNDQRIEVSGTHGAALYDNRTSSLRVCVGRPCAESIAWDLAPLPQRLIFRALRRAGRPAWLCVAPPAHCRLQQMKHFVDGIVEGHPIEPDFHEGARIHALMEAIVRSAETGEWVEMGTRNSRLPQQGRGAVVKR